MTPTRILETLGSTVGGAVVGFGTGLVVGELAAGGVVLAAVASVSSGINGLFGGLRRVYKWNSVSGWFAWLADSSWALVTTTLGNVLNVVNLVIRDSVYRQDFGVRQNRQVYEHGFALKKGFANTQGCVISNAGKGAPDGLDGDRDFVDRHETLHIWQERWFGPLHPLIYIIWAVGGAIVAVSYWVATPRRSEIPLGRLIETTAYYDNPFEYWAYRNDEHWDDNSALPVLKWGG